MKQLKTLEKFIKKNQVFSFVFVLGFLLMLLFVWAVSQNRISELEKVSTEYDQNLR